MEYYKKYWIPGALVIDSQLFHFVNAACFCSRPEDSILLKPNKTIDGIKCYLYDENTKLSIFNEYYTENGIAAYCGEAYHLSKTYDDALELFEKSINDIEHLYNAQKNIDDLPSLANRQILLSSVAAFEVFITDIYIIKALSSPSVFASFANKFYSKQIQAPNPYSEYSISEWEHKILETIIKEPKANVQSIIDRIKHLYKINIHTQAKTLENHFYNRHLIAHKNGLKKDGSFIEVSDSELLTLNNDIKTFVNYLYRKIQTL